jgi:transposase
MLSFSGSLKIYVAVEGCDMRKSFEGLQALVTTVLDQEIRNVYLKTCQWSNK